MSNSTPFSSLEGGKSSKSKASSARSAERSKLICVEQEPELCPNLSPLSSLVADFSNAPDLQISNPSLKEVSNVHDAAPNVDNLESDGCKCADSSSTPEHVRSSLEQDTAVGKRPFSDVFPLTKNFRHEKRLRSCGRYLKHILDDHAGPNAQSSAIRSVLIILFRRRARDGRSNAAHRSRLCQGWTAATYLRTHLPAHHPADVDNALSRLKQLGIVEESCGPHEQNLSWIRQCAVSIIHLLLLPTLKKMYRMVPGHCTNRGGPLLKVEYLENICAYLGSGPSAAHPAFRQRMIDRREPHGLRVSVAILKQAGPCFRFSPSVRQMLDADLS